MPSSRTARLLQLAGCDGERPLASTFQKDGLDCLGVAQPRATSAKRRDSSSLGLIS
jgi:hypothetical protein